MTQEEFSQEIFWIKMDGFNENNADEQIDKIKELYEEYGKELKGRTYGQIWEEATGEQL